MVLLGFPVYKLIILFFSIFFAGLVDSIAGGGGILSIPAYLFLGLPGHMVLGTNKFSSSIGTLFATIRFAISNKINWVIAIISVIFALVGSSIGSRLVLLIPVNFIKILLIILIPVITIITLIPKKNNLNLNKENFPNISHQDFNIEVIEKNRDIDENNKTIQLYKIKYFYFYLIAALSSLVIGMYDGFFGPGTGTFFILVYTTFLKFDMTTASGNSKVVNLASNVAALITFLIYKKVYILLGIFCALFSIAGNLLGSTLAVKKGSKVIKPVFVLALLLLFSKVVYDLILRR